MNLRCEAGGIISKEGKEPETGPMYLIPCSIKLDHYHFLVSPEK